jgi:recombination protein RecT
MELGTDMLSSGAVARNVVPRILVISLKGEAMANEGTVTVKKPEPVLERLNLAKTNLQARLPQGIDRDRFFLGILTAVQKSKANAKPGTSLADCDPNSVLLAAYDAAEVGCSLSPALALGWLIPYGKEAQFQPSYRFFIQKAYETGEVKTFYAEVVYVCDEFMRQFAPKRNLMHAPGNGERTMKTAIGAYAFIEFQDGTVDWEYLTAEQIGRHRAHSKQPNSMKWVGFWEEGWRITPIRVLSKRLPLKNRSFENLVEMVNRDAERDLIIPADEIMEPSAPKRLSDSKHEKAATTITDKPAEKPAEEKQEKQEHPIETQSQGPEPNAPATAQPAAAPTMFPEEDPFISSADISDFWQKAFAAGWKKNEVGAHLKEHFKVDALKDLRKSQLEKALEVISKPKA